MKNFTVIAHIDHGKSTLCDRILELTGDIEKGKHAELIMDSMPQERRRGITIKAKAVRVVYNESIFNIVDTPGHVDFSYEVSRSMSACEGAILVVDALQGVQAQTVANLEFARKQGLSIIPVINKITPRVINIYFFQSKVLPGFAAASLVIYCLLPLTVISLAKPMLDTSKIAGQDGIRDDLEGVG